MKLSPRISSAAVIALLAVLVAGDAVQAEGEKYFASDALLGTLSGNSGRSRAMFYSGKHNRTYVTYCDHDFYTRITYYDHDTGRWAEPVQVDDVLFNDGHNLPGLLITNDGYLHLFYGCHADPVKYARSLYPEDISRWRLGKYIGRRATYPGAVQIANGDILLFYRRSITRDDCPLTVHRSIDNGSTWDEGHEIVHFEDAWCYIRDILYDAVENMVYIGVREGGYHPPPKMPYAVKYNPVTRHVLGMNGVDLGAEAMRDELDANDCRGEWSFVRWGTSRVIVIPPYDGYRGLRYSPDGVTVRRYLTVIVADEPQKPVPCHDVWLWTSPDGGKTWDDGKVIVDRAAIPDNPYGLQLVRNYPGSGPLVIFQGVGDNASPEFVYRYEIRQQYHIMPIEIERPNCRLPWYGTWEIWNNYNRPMRRGQRLYALDRDYQLVASRGSETD